MFSSMSAFPMAVLGSPARGRGLTTTDDELHGYDDVCRLTSLKRGGKLARGT